MLKFMSSPSLTDLGNRDQTVLDERGTQQRRAGANATWNSIQDGVISVFQRKGLPETELYNLNEGVRQLLKTELGSFFTEYLQNQLLTKGMVILRDKIRFYEGQKLLDTLAETWDFFFTDVLPMLQAIFCPVQGKEPSVRQLALLHFRNIITLNIKLEDGLSRPRARVPPSIVQMLLILQGVHESKGATEEYLKLESLLQRVVSPYLGTYGVYTDDGHLSNSCFLEKRLLRRCPKSGDIVMKNPVVRSKSYNNPLLTPVAEYDSEGGTGNGSGIRRHSVSEITTFIETHGYSNLTTIMDAGSRTSMIATTKNYQAGEHEVSIVERPHSGRSSTSEQQPQRLRHCQDPSDGQNAVFRLHQDSALMESCSPENLPGQILESVESDSGGIFIDFSHSCSISSNYNRDMGSKHSIV
ncbi:proline-rich protein 5 isoform X2 [Protopterus annectens]|uniref:proline-rich protein 5 isoform X2 n=1 Tax=Protopterus annectens TaxID=7888 RepID=UPI001CFA9927|nr:proline-rich protein 5 isoform X2 [Protopterus annectens]